MTAGPVHPFSDLDDDFHVPSTNRWETETCWFSWNVPERKLGGWLYSYLRSNLGLCGGGAWVWDDSAYLPWELPYYANHAALRIAPGPRDLRDYTFENGVRVKQLKPLMRYALAYADRDPEVFRVELEFEGLMEPHAHGRGQPPFTLETSSHFDQPGRLRGEMHLRGERIEVDCLSVRDRSWGPRTDRSARIRVGYSFGTASAEEAWLVFAVPDEIQGVDRVNEGYLVRDSRYGRLVSGERTLERDPVHGYVTAMRIRAADEHGRALEAEGRALSRMVVPRPESATWNTLLDWRWHGQKGFGEDQDVWGNVAWSRYRRTLGGGPLT